MKVREVISIHYYSCDEYVYVLSENIQTGDSLGEARMANLLRHTEEGWIRPLPPNSEARRRDSSASRKCNVGIFWFTPAK